MRKEDGFEALEGVKEMETILLREKGSAKGKREYEKGYGQEGGIKMRIIA